MENIDNVEVEKLQNAKFVKPFRMNYSQVSISVMYLIYVILKFII